MRTQIGLLTAVLAVTSPALADPLEGLWRGNYTCMQGTTPLELFVSTDGDGAPNAYFHFGGGRSGLPEGCFTMHGTAAKDRLTLMAGEWRTRPTAYVTVDIAGAVAGGRYQGKVTGPGCGTFSLIRQELSPIPAMCRKRGAATS